MTTKEPQPQAEQKNHQKPDETSSRKLKDDSSHYAKYFSAGFQIISPVILGVLAGIWLDDYFEKDFPLFTIILSSVMIVVALYLFIKQLK